MMNSLPHLALPLAQLGADHGWLTGKLLSVTLSSAEWVVWLLAVLSVLSMAVIFERLVFFSGHRLTHSGHVSEQLLHGDFEGVQKAIAGKRGLEAEVIRQGIAAAPKGADTVEQVIAKVMARERPQYERFLSFLGTLGNNAPFVGLFGTVLGIIKAFHDLGAMNTKGAAIQQTVMSGISEALVATAVGLAVAIPAVVAFNGFNRWLKTLSARTQAHGFALVGFLRGER